jgi:RNA polymerase sigma-70 factor (ECF subfamily)
VIDKMRLADRDLPNEDGSEYEEIGIALDDCIDKLPARSKETLLMHRMEGMKQKDIAEKLNISVQTIKNQIWTSMQRLKDCLETKEAVK